MTTEATTNLQLTLDCFDLKEVIGHGQFGQVRKGIFKATQAETAIKIIPKAKIQGPHFYNQLQREIEIHSRLKHKNICQLFTYFHDQDNVYIVLEFCKHGTLASEIHEKREELSDKKIASIFEQLIHAVAYMHQRHVMHRDIKLQNILLDENFNIKLSDFGCCRHHVKPTFKRRTTFCGTMEYICPQMIKQQPYTNSVDVYCVGIILYELFFFTSPFLGSDQDETFKNIKEKKVNFNDALRKIPDEAKDLIIRLLDKDPRNRPSARSLLSDGFITKYLYSPENDHKVKQRRFTEDTFTKWKEEVGMSVREKKELKNEDNMEAYPELDEKVLEGNYPNLTIQQEQARSGQINNDEAEEGKYRTNQEELQV